MKKAKLIMVAAISCMCLNSCALMFNGTKQRVNINSMTPDSKIYVNGELKGTDAVSVKLPRKDNHTVMIKKDGCKTETVHIESDIQVGWIIFDALLNWFAFLTDAPTGAWKSFDKTKVTVELDCNKK